MSTITDLINQPFGSIPELIGIHAKQAPGHPAFILNDNSLSYFELDAQMTRIAASLQRDGVKPRDTIAICASTSIEYAVLFLGCLRAGVAVAPLPTSSTEEALAAMLSDSEAKKLFVSADLLTLTNSMDGIVPLPIVINAQDGIQALKSWIASAGTEFSTVNTQPDWPFNVIYSSGTTGAPKGIMQPLRMRWGHIQRSIMNGYGPQAVTLLSTPLYSNTTLVSFFGTVALGGTIVLMPKFDVRSYLHLAEKHRVTHTMLVPVQYQRIMAHSDFDRFDLGSFQMKFCTSAPFDAATKADVLKRWPGGLIEYYGMTEGGISCILEAHKHPNKLHTVGTAALGCEVRFIDDAGRELPRGAIGEIVGHSASIMTGYLNQPEKTADAEWFNETGKRFIRTGDIGRFDEDGFLLLLDRRKDMIISGGFNLYPSDLEAVLSKHPQVAEVAVVGITSTRWGETPVAFIVPRPDTAPKAEELLLWANARLAKMQRLAAVEVVDSLPYSAIGKVLKRQLRDTCNLPVD